MANQIEIFRASGGRYEMCDVIYWPTDRKPDFIIVSNKDGREMICRQAMGAWCEMNDMDIILRLRIAEEAMKEALK